MKKVAVIGAGAAGLTATKRLSEPDNGLEFCTFEQTDNVGGTWVYTDKTGKDEYGIPVHSSMYQGLRTNLPKHVMTLPDFPHKEPSKSYMSSQEVLDYYEEFADHFDLRKYIKFRRRVNGVTPIADGKWKVEVTDLKNQKTDQYYFDAVVICIGNYSNPVYPEIKGIENFKGTQIHSHYYREPSMFSNKTVVVIGAGASGLDITTHTAGCAKKVYFSHHNEKARKVAFPENVIQKPDLSEVTEDEIIFCDGTKVTADVIVYCTGYEFKYPFLSPECKIKVENMVVKPLYKHLINIEHPTMCIIGVPRDCPAFALFDVQISCFINILNGKVVLPSKEEMYRDTERDMREKPGGERNYHNMSKDATNYFTALAFLGNLPKTQQILLDIYSFGKQRIMDDFRNFRSEMYHVIDNQRFIVKKPSDL